MRACLHGRDAWRLRGRTALAAAELCRARLLIALVPLRRWHTGLGSELPDTVACEVAAEARRLAIHVERAAARLPFATKCLPRAMALSRLLRRARIAHALVFAVRPADRRDGSDALHAWIEQGGARVIGDLPGPWIEVHRSGGARTPRA